MPLKEDEIHRYRWPVHNKVAKKIWFRKHFVRYLHSEGGREVRVASYNSHFAKQ